MASEFENQINNILQDQETRSKILKIINAAAEEFPCLSCPSKDECGSFQWFVKWFGKNEQ